MSGNSNRNEKPLWNSRFGYIMVAAGAAIGLGNIWRFPYLAYAGGGGAFVAAYIVVMILLGHPLVEMETAIGRYGRKSVTGSFGAINKKWSFIGTITIICSFLIDVYYLVVSGWVLKYLVDYIIGTDFGVDKNAFFTAHIESSVAPVVYSAIVMLVVVFFLYFGITKYVEKITQVILPLLFCFMIICGIWALVSAPNGLEGLKFYLVPDFSKFTWKIFADVCSQVMFSVGVGWGIFTTLGASIPDENNLRSDAWLVSICDTVIALLAGFVVIPSVIGADMEMVGGKALVFNVMTEVFEKLPGGRIMGIFFFLSLVFAVFSTFFTTLEIPAKYVEEKLKTDHKYAVIITGGAVFILGAICSLGFGVLSGVQLPWLDAAGISYYSIYDFLDLLTGYILLPLGCLLTAFFVARVWTFKGYEKELSRNGETHTLSLYNRLSITVIIPVLTIIVLLNCFGFIK